MSLSKNQRILKKKYAEKWRQSIAHVKYFGFDPVWNFIQKYMPDCGILLDAGCGDGKYLSRYKDKIEKERSRLMVIGVDISEMPAQFYPNVCVADVVNLPFKSNAFDGIYSTSVLHYVENIEQTIAELHRVIKPNGILLFTICTKYSLWTLKREILNNIFKDRFDSQYLSYISPSKIKTVAKRVKFEILLVSGYKLYLPVLIARVINYVSKKCPWWRNSFLKDHNSPELCNMTAFSRIMRFCDSIEKKVPNSILAILSYHAIFVLKKSV